MRIPVRAFLALLLTVAACDDNTPTDPSGGIFTPTIVTELFAGILASGQTSFYSFRVSSGGTVSVMLATTASDAGLPLSREIQMGLGVPSGTVCSVSSTVTARAALSSQISSVLAPGTYCVNITDPGTAKDPVNFNIRITHP